MLQEVTHYLVKWCSLPYEESTWELEEDVDPGKIKEFEALQIPPEIKHMVTYPEVTYPGWQLAALGAGTGCGLPQSSSVDLVPGAAVQALHSPLWRSEGRFQRPSPCCDSAVSDCFEVLCLMCSPSRSIWPHWALASPMDLAPAVPS